VDVGIIEFVTTDLLSQNMSVGPSIGIPNIHSFYCSPSNISMAIHNAMNSDPKVDDSTVFEL
jgi:hypothetical protein